MTRFDDLIDRVHIAQQGNTDDYHNATGLIVDQESYAWSYEPADAMILFKWTFAATRLPVTRTCAASSVPKAITNTTP